MIFFNILMVAATALAGTSQDTFKDQYCTDPRTMRKHAAYTEWADAYSCTRHRCQPGGRNLAIYTVGCKRVEAPESAIECEEVVEDTNMQFPFCCTRLRCLIVVRGEVWTRVLGQPWETLPAAPWSHMYKMKKPPPPDGSFLPKRPAQAGKGSSSVAATIWDEATGLSTKLNGEGPIYELTSDSEDANREKVLRASKGSTPTEAPDCNEVIPRAAVVPAPDIVIALSTSEGKDRKKNKSPPRHKRKKVQSSNLYLDDNETHNEPELSENEDSTPPPEKSFGSEEQVFANAFGVTQKVPFKSQSQNDIILDVIIPRQDDNVDGRVLESHVLPVQNEEAGRAREQSPRPTTSRTPGQRVRSRTMLDQDRDRFAEIERQRVEAEIATARAFSQAVEKIQGLSTAIREGSEAMAHGLNNIAEAFREHRL